MNRQVAVFPLACLSTACCFFVSLWNQWAISAQASSLLLNQIWAFRGIWEECIQWTLGQWQCDNFLTPNFSLPSYLVAIRALMCISMIASIVATFALLVGMECSKFCDDDLGKKRNIVRGCGVSFLLSGLLTLGSVSWYTAMITQDFFSYTNQDNLIRYEIGAALYLGYVSAFLSLVTGLSCFYCPGEKDDVNEYPRPNHVNMFHRKSGMDYV